MLREDRHGPEHFKNLMEHLMLIAALYPVKVPMDSLPWSIIVTVSRVSIHSVRKTANTTRRTVTLGTLALTSTNGRACTPRRRVLQPTSAMDALCGVVNNYFVISMRKAARGPSRVVNPKKYILPCLVNICPYVLPLIGRHTIRKFYFILFSVSYTSRYHLKQTPHKAYESTMPDTLALTSTISRACIPGKRATMKASALTSALGRACIPRADVTSVRIWML